MSDEQKKDAVKTGEGSKDMKPGSGRPAWIAGAVLIVIGLVFIIKTFMGFALENWWALFILIPAAGALWSAWTIYNKNGRRFNAASRGPLIGGLVLLYLVIIFLFDLDFEVMWPGFLLIVGGGLLLTAFGPQAPEKTEKGETSEKPKS